MKLICKRFDELTTIELYKIMQLRVDVFVVEQKCPYRELDDMNQDSIHVWYEENGQIQAYPRVLDKGGRKQICGHWAVIAVKRRCGMGSRILSEGIRIAKEVFHTEKIYLEARVYARKLYEKQGFKQISHEFFMDDIPHVKMLLDLVN